MIDFRQGDRALVEDEHAIYTGEVVDAVEVVVTDDDGTQVQIRLYVVELDDGRALLVEQRDLWPEHPTPIPGEPVEGDGVHEWSRP